MKALMLLKTEGLEYDDRVRKESLSLSSLGHSLVIGVLENANVRNKASVTNDIEARSISLSTRRLLPHRKGLFLKTLEMYVRFYAICVEMKPDVVWLHNIEMAGLLPVMSTIRRFGGIKRLIWDQHELPPEHMMGSRVGSTVLRRLFRMPDAVIVANPERKDYLLNKCALEAQYVVIENYPDVRFADMDGGKLPGELQEWLKGSSYLLAQGGASPGRYLDTVIEAIMRLDSIKLIVVGSYDNRKIEGYESKWGGRFRELVYFTGMVPQMDIPSYLDNALASVILYADITRNNWFCAPNRLYQALSRGIPVIVGSNPTMSRIVSDFGCGVVLEDDGRDVNGFMQGVLEVLREEDYLSRKAHAARCAFRWEAQNRALAQVIDP